MHNAHMILHTFIGVGTHKGIVPPAPAPLILPHISVDTLLGLTMKAEYSNTELGMGGIQLVARGNDSGLFVPHFSIPMNNVLLPLTIALGGSKVMFGSSKVKINAGGAKDCGCCLPPFIPLSSNQACNDPCNYPSDYVISPNTVEVGMTLGDLIGGLISMAVDTGVSAFVGWAGGKVTSGIASGAARHILGRQVGQEAFYEAAGDFGENWIARSAASAARDQFAREAVEEFNESLAGRYALGIIGETITKPAVQTVTNPLGAGLLGNPEASDATEASHDLAADPPPQGDPPIYNTSDPESNPDVNVDDDGW